MTKTEYVFLSYRSIEADFALKLASDLKNAGVKLWMDRLDGIKVGMDWRDVIEHAINTCAAMIIVLSPEYVKSEYCKKELYRANRLNRPIFPVLLSPVESENWPFVIEGLQYEDFTNWVDEQSYIRCLEKLLQRLQEESPGQVGEVPNTETRYLTSLIAELESQRGVLEYIDLQAEIDLSKERPKPPMEDECGFVELLDKPKAIAESRKTPLRSISEAVEKFQRFVLVGEPGAGKTTTIRRLAREAARRRLENPRTEPLPLLLYLPQWHEELTPHDFVRTKYPFLNDPTNLLKPGDTHLYLDGLNEMGAEGARKAKLLRDWFWSFDAPSRVIVTCRLEDYDSNLSLDMGYGISSKIPVVVAQELDDDNIRQFALNYLGDKKDQFLSQIIHDSSKNQKGVRSLIHLARNPYLLRALTFLYEMPPENQIPTNPGELFQRLTRALWKREELRNTTRGTPFEQIEAAFAKLAFTMIDEDMSTNVTISYATNTLGNTDSINLGLNASYIATVGGQVRFYHQLMQEYFAAIELQNHTIRDKVMPDQWDKLPRERKSNKWDEVIIALSGIVLLQTTW